MTTNEIEDTEFYPLGLLEQQNILDRRVYRGKGRPRKTDYMTFSEANKYLNELMLKYIVGKV